MKTSVDKVPPVETTVGEAPPAETTVAVAPPLPGPRISELTVKGGTRWEEVESKITNWLLRGPAQQSLRQLHLEVTDILRREAAARWIGDIGDHLECLSISVDGKLESSGGLFSDLHFSNCTALRSLHLKPLTGEAILALRQLPRSCRIKDLHLELLYPNNGYHWGDLWNLLTLQQFSELQQVMFSIDGYSYDLAKPDRSDKVTFKKLVAKLRAGGVGIYVNTDMSRGSNGNYRSRASKYSTEHGSRRAKRHGVLLPLQFEVPVAPH